MFLDLARPLNALTRINTEFEWTPKCQESFKLLKTSLMADPILTYPDLFLMCGSPMLVNMLGHVF